MNVYLPFIARLPSTYQEVEWIAGSGSSDNGTYIDIGYSFQNNNGSVSMKYSPVSFGNTYYQSRATGSYNNPNRSICIYGCYSPFYIGLGGNDINTSKAITASGIYTVDIQANSGNYSLSLNGDISTGTYTGTIVNNKTIALFGSNENTTGVDFRSSIKLYYYKLWDNGVLKRYMIPCYRKSDSVIGLYDLVNNQFYTNAGTGTFSKGNDVIMAELKNAYIGEAPLLDYLCFTANTAGSTVKLNKNGTPASVTLETSTDGTNWVTYSFGTTITLTNIGDKVYFRNTSGTDTLFSTGGNDYYQFVMTGSINGGGDVTTLLNKSGTNVIPDWGLYILFWRCTPLVTMPELPATEVGQYGYYMMFSGCTSLNDMKELPATTLGYRCYGEMFSQCSNLTYLPKLRITTLPDYCYYSMFSGCSKIKLSTTQTGEYQTAYRIPTSGTGSAQQYSIGNMFNNTGGTFTGTPSINTTYYTSNTVV